jgi:hypothetical protein
LLSADFFLRFLAESDASQAALVRLAHTVVVLADEELLARPYCRAELVEATGSGRSILVVASASVSITAVLAPVEGEEPVGE